MKKIGTRWPRVVDQCGAIDVGHAEGHLGLMINERDCRICRRTEFVVVGHICFSLVCVYLCLFQFFIVDLIIAHQLGFAIWPMDGMKSPSKVGWKIWNRILV